MEGVSIMGVRMIPTPFHDFSVTLNKLLDTVSVFLQVLVEVLFVEN